MPLVAFLDGERIESCLSTDEHWDLLKSVYKSRTLVMRCGVPGVPRTSRRGLKHFAHKAGVERSLINCWSESPQHRMIKTLIAQAARDAGWQVSVEWSAEGRACRLLRHWFAKGTSLSSYTAEDLKRVQDKLNRCPRPTMDLPTPAQKLNRMLPSAA